MDNSAGTARRILDLCSTVAKTVGLRQPAVFEQLWLKGRLRIQDCHEFALPHDHILSRLVQKAIETRRSLFIRVPNYDGFTVSLAFATAIASEAVENIGKTTGTSKILLVGTTVDVRRYLRQTHIGNFKLDAIFAQSDMSKSRVFTDDAVEQALGNSLPKVVTSYDPIDIKGLLHTIGPHWVAADIRKYALPHWLPALIEEVAKTRTPLLLFFRSRFSELAEYAQKCDAQMVELPLVGVEQARHLGSTGDAPLWTVDWTTTFVPLVPGGSTTDTIDESLKRVQARLTQATRLRLTGSLDRSSLMLAWRAYRFLTTVSCPMGIAESAASSVWGAKPWSQLEASLEALLKTLAPTNPTLHLELDAAFSEMQATRKLMGDSDVPLWNAMVNLVLEKKDESKGRTIVFHGRAKRTLFEFGLLARCNLSIADLDSINVKLVDFAHQNRSYRTLRQQVATDLDPTRDEVAAKQGPLTMVGLPSWTSALRLDPWVRGRQVEVCCYPHQVGELRRQAGWLGTVLGTNTDNLEQVFRTAGASWDVALSPTTGQVFCAAPTSLNDARSDQLTVSDGSDQEVGPIAPNLNQMDEVAALLQLDDDDSDDGSAGIRDEDQEEGGSDSLIVSKAVELEFAGALIGLFAENDFVNLVVNKSGEISTEPRYVRSIRAGDVLFFIHGSRRQNLYDILISRLHQDPALEVTLELIKRWQEGIAQAFRSRYLTSGYSVEDFLRDLQGRGSDVSVPLTVHFWLTGHTLGPNDPEDLLRIGSILDIPLLKAHHTKVAAALRRIRGLHRSLAHRLTKWIEAQVSGDRWDSDDEVLDAEFGIHLRDFRDSVQLLRVESIRAKTGTFLWRSLGELTKKE